MSTLIDMNRPALCESTGHEMSERAGQNELTISSVYDEVVR